MVMVIFEKNSYDHGHYGHFSGFAIFGRLLPKKWGTNYGDGFRSILAGYTNIFRPRGVHNALCITYERLFMLETKHLSGE